MAPITSLALVAQWKTSSKETHSSSIHRVTSIRLHVCPAFSIEDVSDFLHFPFFCFGRISLGRRDRIPRFRRFGGLSPVRQSPGGGGFHGDPGTSIS